MSRSLKSFAHLAPSITSPSPGICSPAFTITISPFLRVAEDTFVICSFRSAEGILCASTSFLEAHNESACAFPLPSAIASAKFAKIQVNQRMIAIANVYPLEVSLKPNREMIHNPVVNIAEI